jgi:hypothetical protein
MKAMKRELKSVLSSLKMLTQRTEKMLRELDRLEKAAAAEKGKRKARPKTRPSKRRVAKKTLPRKEKKVAAIDTVFALIKRSPKGLNTTVLKRKTGFNDRKIWNIINSLKKQGKIKSEQRGLYVKA